MIIADLTSLLSDYPPTLDVRLLSGNIDVCVSKLTEINPNGDSNNTSENYILLQ